MLDGRDRWFPVGFLALILIGDCGDLCVGGYVCMCFGYFVWFAYFLMIFCFCQYLCFYRSLVGFFILQLSEDIYSCPKNNHPLVVGSTIFARIHIQFLGARFILRIQDNFV
jgi:hypothetical protein